MNPLLEQFLSEAREFLQGIAEKLLQLENQPDCGDTMNELFRLVHTLKGNSGLFEFPEMTRVLHAGEDLLDAVRDGRVQYSQELADRLLDAMDFVNELIDEIEANGRIGADHSQTGARLADSLRQLLHANIQSATASDHESIPEADDEQSMVGVGMDLPLPSQLLSAAEELRMSIYRKTATSTLLLLEYSPEEECFFKGEDPFHQARQIPELLWSSIGSREPWPAAIELDAYRCLLHFQVLTCAPLETLHELFRYMPEQIRISPLPAIVLAIPQGDPNGGPVYEDFVEDALCLLDKDDLTGLEAVARAMLELTSPGLWMASALRWLLLVLELEPDNRHALRILVLSLRTLQAPDWQNELPRAKNTVAKIPPAGLVQVTEVLAIEPSPVKPTNELDQAIRDLLQAQREILSQPDSVSWLAGRLASVAATIAAINTTAGRRELLPSLQDALLEAQKLEKSAPLLDWLDRNEFGSSSVDSIQMSAEESSPTVETSTQQSATPALASVDMAVTSMASNGDNDGEVKFGRRAEDAYTGPKTLKVDQDKIDRLMGLIGEMVVAKNSLPYLAGRAETQYGVRELSREIKTQYAVINRIAEEMQDAIMQVRMMPVSFIFQRFPRLVRDTSRKLNKEVNLILEGENTEADKNIVEALADPLIHIVRNSLDHGIENPEVRRAAGKPAAGRLTIRAKQESDRALIEIIDDGKGIDPKIVKQKAYEKGIIDEAVLERITDQEAINLVFAAGFSTAETISDLSGRGVGMDVVRNAIEKVNGSIYLESEVGKGTTLRLSLPLSMAVTNVMIIEFDNQIFGVPMDLVVETVRVPRTAIKTIKRRQTTVLRGRIVPLLSLNELLVLDAEPQANDDDELATLVVRVNDEHVGILVDDFRETVDIILKPMVGILGGLGGYSGSALLGDGSVLMVLNPRELV